jgi:hypothetical protein
LARVQDSWLDKNQTITYLTMKKLYTFLAIACVAFSANAQIVNKDSTWTFGGFTSLQTNQVALVNWAAGGENSFSATALVQLYANLHKKGWKWENRLDLGYGLMYTKSYDWQKNEDKIDFLSKLARPIANSKVFSYAAEANFKTQFQSGYTLPNDSTAISRFLAPGYLIASLGVEYKPVEWITVYISPVTGKFTFVNDQKLADAGSFGVKGAEYDPTTGLKTQDGEGLNAEFGAYFKFGLKKDIMKNVTLATDLNLFNNYTDKDADNRKNIDVDWQTSINMKVNKWLTVSLFTHLIYDNDINIAITDSDGNAVFLERADGTQFLDGDGNPIQKVGARIQFKEVAGVGLSYKF